jgi:hypothetical protein
MSRVGHPVQDNTLDANMRVKLHTTGHHCRHGSGNFGAIHAHDHRCLQQLGHFGCTGAAFKVDAVKQTAVALDNADIIISGMG